MFYNIPRLSIDILKRDYNSDLIISQKLKTTLRKDFWSVVFVDGRNHTSNIKLLDYWENIDTFQLIPAWTDGCIIYNIWKQRISLTVPLADCGWIWFTNNTGTLIGIAHAWHLWTARDIVWEIFKKLESLEEIKNLKFYLAPMIGKNYEFSISDYKNNFWDTLQKYSLNPDTYLKRINTEKWHLDLKQIIIDMLLYHWIKRENIQESKIETNNPDAWYASHRMYTITKEKRYEGRNLFIVSK